MTLEAMNYGRKNMFNLKTLTVGAASLAIMASAAAAETVIRLQSVLPTSGDEVHG